MSRRLIDAASPLNTIEKRCKDCPRRKGIKNGKYQTLYRIGEAPCRACDIDDAIAAIEDAPTIDAVEVVRCKDCKHAETLFFGGLTGKKVLLCNAWQAYINPSMYDYCSKGERREADATD